jgi:predicted metal-dependent hydrolase
MTSGFPDGGRPPGQLEYAIRVSDRARHVRLVVSVTGELIVVVPRRFDRRRVPSIVEDKRAWIERARTRVEARRLAGEAEDTQPGLPGRIALPALGEEWEVEYRPASDSFRSGSPTRGESPAAIGTRSGSGGRRTAVAREFPGGRLVVTGATEDEDACSRALISWLRRRARDTLVPRLEQLAAAHRLSFERASVRHQRTRWASCSPRGAISLNLRLLFLESAVVDHVLLHELCHTRELNHSERFWALLRAHDPEWAAHGRQARSGWRSLPAWIHPRNVEPRV